MSAPIFDARLLDLALVGLLSWVVTAALTWVGWRISEWWQERDPWR